MDGIDGRRDAWVDGRCISLIGWSCNLSECYRESSNYICKEKSDILRQLLKQDKYKNAYLDMDGICMYVCACVRVRVCVCTCVYVFLSVCIFIIARRKTIPFLCNHTKAFTFDDIFVQLSARVAHRELAPSKNTNRLYRTRQTELIRRVTANTNCDITHCDP